MNVPARISGAPYCRSCGMTEGHWLRVDGRICPPEGSNARTKPDRLGQEKSVPGAASTARAPANPDETGADEMNDTRSALGASQQGPIR